MSRALLYGATRINLQQLSPQSGTLIVQQSLDDEQKRSLWIREIIKALKYRRLDRNLTIEQVAAASGVHKSVISRFENEATDPHLSTMLRYADAVGAEFMVLLDGTPILKYEDRQALSQMVQDIQRQKNELYRELIAEESANNPNPPIRFTPRRRELPPAGADS